MLKFLLKGILRDRSRSILPIIIITIGVALTVLLSGYITGVFADVIDQNARFDTGHVKVMSRAYAENIEQLPNDLALLEIDELKDKLRADYPAMEWESRIRFGGLLDVPDEEGNSAGQGPVSGMSFNLFDSDSREVERVNLTNALVTGNIPAASGEALIGHDFSQKLGLNLGDTVTYFGTTMNSAMTFQNFTVAGTVRFGTPALDKGALIIDVSDAQIMLDMENASGEILGFAADEIYREANLKDIAADFNAKYAADTDEFAPVMQTLREQNNLAVMIDQANQMSGVFVFIFICAMSVVLWNTGLLAGLRRYQEFGIRLALGEAKGTIYRRLLSEAVLIGLIGSVVGTALGLLGVYLLQKYGIDISGMNQDSSMLMPSVLRAKFTPDLLWLGFIPGLLAMLFGTALSGTGIYRRETATLFKEMEV